MSRMMQRSMCRICLMENIRMNPIINTHLQEMFEMLSERPLETKDCRPLELCFICHKRLQHCYSLRMKCLRSEDLFEQLANNSISDVHLLPLPCQLETSPMAYVTFPGELDNPDDVKMELEDYEDLDVKQEDTEDINSTMDTNGNDSEENTQSSESDDNIPLKVIKNESERKIRKKKRLRVRKRESDDLKKCDPTKTRTVAVNQVMKMFTERLQKLKHTMATNLNARRRHLPLRK